MCMPIFMSPNRKISWLFNPMVCVDATKELLRFLLAETS